ncbi:hypothetical protein DBZ36_12730 [Alginatibacterium sediminis]|uniref:Outer membrane protein beta-barrel domain-containing protein n=1 Tax=Alginatibacterium sediminis TaxID=2164068 RepID=A0A420EBP0_9ALTE|nr:hypothetical protein [Alginatibacterium sediminis]RKF18095.1 hypothetical protein DBZ36_12730 [Alginatibacterium sediminis]
MKKSTLALLLALASTGAFAADTTPAAQEEVNYGDPTASFSTLGVSASKDTTQLNGMMGLGANIFQLDLGADNKKGDVNYRGRYFHVTDGLGYSVDVLGDKNSTTALAGMIYKFQVTDNISIFPMASLGYTDTKAKGANSTLAQAGVYAMYGFDDGHWVYANPKTTYHVKNKQFINQVEVGGGLMVADKVSVGAKIEYTAKYGNQPEDTVAWIQANYYF